MKLLVIGAKGQLAQALAQGRWPKGVDIRAIGRPTLDLLMPDTIDRAIDSFEPNLVVNAAAYTAVDKAEREPRIAYAINAEGARHVATACAARHIPLIHISTDYVFDGRCPSPYREDHAVGPLGLYGRSKLEGERCVAANCPQHVILRTAWLYSPFGHNFVIAMLRLAERQSSINVVDDQIGSPTYAKHLAAAVVLMAQSLVTRRDNSLFGTYHAAGSGEATWYEFARRVFEQTSRLGGPTAQIHRITSAEYPTLARRPVNSRLDCSKLASAFGIQLPNWRTGIAECVHRLIVRGCCVSLKTETSQPA